MRKLIFPLIAAMILVQTVPVIAASLQEDTPSSYPESYYWPAQTDSIANWPAAPAIHGEAAVLMDARTGHLLYAKNKDDTHYPASITKILTTLLALEHCDDLKETVTFSARAVYTEEENSSTIWLTEGEELRMNQSLYAVMLASANEAAYGVAEHAGGNLKRFVEEMNVRAKTLGCQHTHFNNANGLPDDRHYTTAYDMGLIAREAWQNRLFRKIAGTQYYTIPPTNKYEETRELYNHHKMLVDPAYLYRGCVGGKTGYTSLAGNTLVTYARRGSVTLICVVLKSDYAVYEDTKTLLDYGFENFHRVSIPLKGIHTEEFPLLPNITYAYPKANRLPVSWADKDGYAVVPKGVEAADLVTRTTYVPCAIGSGRILYDYYYNDWRVGQGEAYSLQPLKRIFSQ